MCMPPPFLLRTKLIGGDRGMHIEATWHKLTDGSWYMDQVTVQTPGLGGGGTDGRL